MTTPNPVAALMTLEPCPFCGMRVPDDLADTLYPSGIYRRNDPRGFHHYVSMNESKAGDQPCWAMHCTENMGGCGARITGDSEAEARSRWNRRAVEASASALAAMPADSVKMPTTEAEAELMAKVGMVWLEQHAPHKLKQQAGGVPAGWQPIESAPKEVELLGWREDCGVLLIMHTSFDRFASDQECEETDEKSLFQEDWFGSGIPGGFERLEGSEVPTHWMPLPADPGAAPNPPAVPRVVDKAELKRLVSLVFGEEFQITRAVPTIKESLTVEPRVPLSEAQIEEAFQEAAGADEETHIRFARAIEALVARGTSLEKVPSNLHTFLDAAAGEGLVVGGIDAADLYVELFPKTYAGIVTPKEPQ